MTSDARRHAATFGLIVGAVVFGMVLAGGLDLRTIREQLEGGQEFYDNGY